MGDSTSAHIVRWGCRARRAVRRSPYRRERSAFALPHTAPRSENFAESGENYHIAPGTITLSLSETYALKYWGRSVLAARDSNPCHTVLASTNKCLAQSNKSPHGGRPGP